MRSRPRARRFRPGRALRPRCAPTCSTASATIILKRRERSAGCWRARRQDRARGDRRSRARRAHFQIFRRRGAAPSRQNSIPPAPAWKPRPSRGGRRIRRDLALEFPDRDPGLENRAGARLRQHGGDEARESDAGHGARWPRSFLRRARRPASSIWCWAGRRSARRSSTTRCGRHFLHRLAGGRRQGGAGAVARQARVQLEMGGKNPLVVLDDADFDRAVQSRSMAAISRPASAALPRPASSSRTASTTASSRRSLPSRALKVGDALDPATQMGPRSARPRCQESTLHRDRRDRRRPVFSPAARRLELDKPGYYMSPALITDTMQMRINCEEVFGPVAERLRQGLRRGARDRQCGRVRPFGRHLHHLAQVCAGLPAPR